MKVILEKRQKVIIGVVISLVIVVLGYRYIYLPKLNQMRKMRVELQSLIFKVKDAQELTKKIPSLEKEVELVQEKFASIKTKVVTKEEIPRVLKQLGKVGEKYNINFVSLKPQPEMSKESELLTLGPEITCKKVPIKVDIRCEYKNLGDYLGALKELPVLTTVDELRIHGEKRLLPKVEAQLILNIYMLEENK